MSRAVLLGFLAVAISGCVTLGNKAPIREVIRFACPRQEPPALYELPPRLDTVRPDDYRAERHTVEGRHEAFDERYGAYRAAKERCPKPEPDDG